jgi:hypothetical protein
MAYMSKENKAKIKAALDVVMKGTGIKWSLAVRHHSSIVLNIKSGPMDFIGNYNATMTDPTYVHYNPRSEVARDDYIQVNVYHFDKHFSGEVKDLLAKILAAMNDGNYDNSDSQRDYFDCGWYSEINVGRWDRPYILNK